MITTIADRHPIISHEAMPMVPALAQIVSRSQETSNTTTYHLQFQDPALGKCYRFSPGQFNMLYLFGIGEAAISISSDPEAGGHLAHTVRHVGSVTFGISRLQDGDVVGVRGPFGSAWPVEACRGRDVLLVAGGIGIAPLRPAIYELLRNRTHYGRLILLYGVRSQEDMIFREEVEAWQSRRDFQVLITVDYPDDDWTGPVGVVTSLLRRVRLDAARTSVFVCGPRVMNRAAAHTFLSCQVPREQVYVSLERNMRCGLGQCGHCQYGPKFVCKDGPVFAYDSIEHLFAKDEV
jgi:NAD(P)H-flavin reductase